MCSFSIRIKRPYRSKRAGYVSVLPTLTQLVRPGGALALVRDNINIRSTMFYELFNGFLWICLHANGAEELWAGGAYFPGPSDPRFRSLQGHGKIDHFDALQGQLEQHVGKLWFLVVILTESLGFLKPLGERPTCLTITLPSQRCQRDSPKISAPNRHIENGCYKPSLTEARF